MIEFVDKGLHLSLEILCYLPLRSGQTSNFVYSRSLVARNGSLTFQRLRIGNDIGSDRC